MSEKIVQKTVLPWWAAGLLLGLVQILAIGLAKPLGVSTEFVSVNTKIIKAVDQEYVAKHPLIKDSKYQKFGYGWWVDVGLVTGALVSAIAVGRWKIRKTTVWWQTNHGTSVVKRFLAGLAGGFLILLGARFAHGCTSGQFASGWAQLSLSALPFTVTLFGFGMLTAYIVYRKIPDIEK